MSEGKSGFAGLKFAVSTPKKTADMTHQDEHVFYYLGFPRTNSFSFLQQSIMHEA